MPEQEISTSFFMSFVNALTPWGTSPIEPEALTPLQEHVESLQYKEQAIKKTAYDEFLKIYREATKKASKMQGITEPERADLIFKDSMDMLQEEKTSLGNSYQGVQDRIYKQRILDLTSRGETLEAIQTFNQLGSTMDFSFIQMMQRDIADNINTKIRIGTFDEHFGSKGENFDLLKDFMDTAVKRFVFELDRIVTKGWEKTDRAQLDKAIEKRRLEGLSLLNKVPKGLISSEKREWLNQELISQIAKKRLDISIDIAKIEQAKAEQEYQEYQEEQAKADQADQADQAPDEMVEYNNFRDESSLNDWSSYDYSANTLPFVSRSLLDVSEKGRSFGLLPDFLIVLGTILGARYTKRKFLPLAEASKKTAKAAVAVSDDPGRISAKLLDAEKENDIFQRFSMDNAISAVSTMNQSDFLSIHDSGQDASQRYFIFNLERRHNEGIPLGLSIGQFSTSSKIQVSMGTEEQTNSLSASSFSIPTIKIVDLTQNKQLVYVKQAIENFLVTKVSTLVLKGEQEKAMTFLSQALELDCAMQQRSLLNLLLLRGRMAQIEQANTAAVYLVVSFENTKGEKNSFIIDGSKLTLTGLPALLVELKSAKQGFTMNELTIQLSATKESADATLEMLKMEGSSDRNYLTIQALIETVLKQSGRVLPADEILTIIQSISSDHGNGIRLLTQGEDRELPKLNSKMLSQLIAKMLISREASLVELATCLSYVVDQIVVGPLAQLDKRAAQCYEMSTLGEPLKLLLIGAAAALLPENDLLPSHYSEEDANNIAVFGSQILSTADESLTVNAFNEELHQKLELARIPCPPAEPLKAISNEAQSTLDYAVKARMLKVFDISAKKAAKEAAAKKASEETVLMTAEEVATRSFDKAATKAAEEAAKVSVSQSSIASLLKQVVPEINSSMASQFSNVATLSFFHFSGLRKKESVLKSIKDTEKLTDSEELKKIVKTLDSHRGFHYGNSDTNSYKKLKKLVEEDDNDNLSLLREAIKVHEEGKKAVNDASTWFPR